MLKSFAEYLSAANGDHEAAARAMHADLTAQHAATEREAGANIRARTIAQHLEPLAQALDLPLPPPGQRPTQDATAALQEAVTDAIDAIDGLEESRDGWRHLAGEAGLDLDAVEQSDSEEALDALLDGWLGGLESAQQDRDTAAQELNVYRFSFANGLNPEAVLRQKGLEGLEQRDVKTTGPDGKEVTTKQWGIPGEKDAFTPALDHLKPVLGGLKVKTDSGTAWLGGQEQQSQGNGSTYDQYLRDQQQRQQQAQTYRDPLAMQPTTTTQGGA